MRYQLFKLINALVGIIPVPIIRRLLRTMHFHPEIANRAGYTVYPQTFYNPFPITEEVDVARLKEKRHLPGINFRLAEAKKLVQDLSRHAGEVREFLKNRTVNVPAWNMTYGPCDSGSLYAMLRHLKPKRYIEVGCGYSSRSSSAALNRNIAEGHACKATYIDPYPFADISSVKLPGEFIKEKIERIPLSLFQELEAGDILFIDTSHILKVQNDVEFELIHVLPALKAGVYVHVHDIFTPYDYPVEWLIPSGPQWGANNEQYALECLLSGGDDWEVVLPVFQLWKDERELLSQLVYTEDRPAAFWIRKQQTRNPGLAVAR